MQKACATCGIVQSLDSFAPHKNGTFGRFSYCRSCVRVRNKAFYEANKERVKARTAAKREANPEANRQALAAWRLANAARVKEYRTRYAPRERQVARARYLREPETKLAQGAARRAARKQAVPKWASMRAIEEQYALAARLTRETGVIFEVDHVIPLQSAVVCGLHWHGNLQVVTRAVNRSKSNRLGDC